MQAGETGIRALLRSFLFGFALCGAAAERAANSLVAVRNVGDSTAVRHVFLGQRVLADDHDAAHNQNTDGDDGNSHQSAVAGAGAKTPTRTLEGCRLARPNGQPHLRWGYLLSPPPSPPSPPPLLQPRNDSLHVQQ